MSEPSQSTPAVCPQRRDLAVAWPSMVVCLAVNALVLMYLALVRPEYLVDYQLNPNPDADHYVLLGTNFLTSGHYSRCHSPPFAPDILRTPVYPIFAGGLQLIGGPLLIYSAQALLSAASCLLLVKLVRPLFGDRAAAWASLLFAGDLMLAIMNAEAMSEPVYLFVNLAALVCLLPVLASTDRASFQAVRLACGGALLAAAALVRPAGMYLPVIMAGLLLWQGVVGRTALKAVVQSMVLLSAAGVPLAAWVARNAIVFSVPRLSNVDAVVLVYCCGAGAYQVEHDLTFDQAQERIVEEFGLPPQKTCLNPWTSDRPVRELDAALRATRRKVLLKYPRSLAISSLLGAAKATVSHNVSFLAEAGGDVWQAPKTGSLWRGDASALRRLFENRLPLVIAFVWQMLYLLPAVILPALGVAPSLRAPHTRRAALVLLCLLAYFYLTVAIFGVDAYYRCRVAHMPLIYAFAGVGLAGLFQRRPSP